MPGTSTPERIALRRAYLLLLLVMVFWSGNALVGKAVVGTVPPVALAFYRWLLAGCLLAPFAWRDAADALPLFRAHWRWMVVLSALSVGAFNTVLYIGLQYTTAVNAAVLNSAMPILIALLSWLIYRARISGTTAIGIALSVTGVLVILTGGDLTRLLTLQLNRGDLISLVAYFCWASYTVFLHRHRPAGLGGKAFLAGQIMIGLALLLPFFVWEAATTPIVLVPGWPLFLAIGYLGIFPSLLSYLCWNVAVGTAGASVAGVFTNLVPALAAIGAVLFLGEAFEAHHTLGIVIIVAGVWLVTRVANRPAR